MMETKLVRGNWECVILAGYYKDANLSVSTRVGGLDGHILPNIAWVKVTRLTGRHGPLDGSTVLVPFLEGMQ